MFFDPFKDTSLTDVLFRWWKENPLLSKKKLKSWESNGTFQNIQRQQLLSYEKYLQAISLTDDQITKIYEKAMSQSNSKKNARQILRKSIHEWSFWKYQKWNSNSWHLKHGGIPVWFTNPGMTVSNSKEYSFLPSVPHRARSSKVHVMLKLSSCTNNCVLVIWNRVILLGS